MLPRSRTSSWALALGVMVGITVGSVVVALAASTLPRVATDPEVTEVPDISNQRALEWMQGGKPTLGGAPAAPSRPEPPAEIAAPPLGVAIEGISMVENSANTGYLWIPPDTHGAAGPAHLVSVVNVSIEWHTKAGVQEASMGLHTFFAPLAPAPVYTLFDPRAIYDQYSGRFVVVVLEQQDTGYGDPVNSSRILVAVSDDSDPNGTWYYYGINSMLNIGGVLRWADNPGLAIDSQAVYITNNMYAFSSGGFAYGGARLWIVNKVPLYGGGGGVSAVYDPAGATGQSQTTMRPTHMFGTVPAGVGTFLVRYSGYSDGTNEFQSIIRVDNPLGAIAFSHQFVACGNIDNTASGIPDAPQLGGSALIDTGDRRTQNAVWRGDDLYTCATIRPPSGPDAATATAHWWRVDTSNLAALVTADQGNVGGEEIAAGTRTYYPSVAADENGNMAIGFDASAPTIYASAYYTGRQPFAPPGTVEPVELLAAGLDYYLRTFGAGSNRWGDYTATVVDPDKCTFWTFLQYADTRGNPTGSEDGRWRTRWGSFTYCTVPVELSDLAVERISDGSAVLRWNVRSSAGHMGFHVYRQAAGGDRERLNEEILTASSGRYEFRDPGASPEGADYWLQEIARDGSDSWFGPVTLAPGGGRPYALDLTVQTNPFRERTGIAYASPGGGRTRLAVYDALGRRVATLVDRTQGPGRHLAAWDGRDDGGALVPAGVYLVRLEAAHAVRSQKVLRLR